MIANTMAFVLNKHKLTGTGYRPQEDAAIHEILTWGRQPGHNKIFMFFGTAMEAFHSACSKLMGRFRSVLPQGCLMARIRQTKWEGRHAKEGTLGDTLGEEAHGFVVVDAAGAPMKYDMVRAMQDMCAKQWGRLEIDVPGPQGKGWRPTHAYVDTKDDEDLDETWQRDMGAGCSHMLEETFVSGNDPHLDAKVWPTAHPYGSGSVFSELGSGGLMNQCQNRLLLIQSWFRRNALWAFWMLNRQIKRQLFFTNTQRRRAGRRGHSADTEADAETRLFGTVLSLSLSLSLSRSLALSHIAFFCCLL